MNATWYVTEDGSAADPAEVANVGGRLRHRDGRAVAYTAHGPRTRSVDVEAERAKASKAKVQPKKGDDKDMKPEAPKGGYKTREAKTEMESE